MFLLYDDGILNMDNVTMIKKEKDSTGYNVTISNTAGGTFTAERFQKNDAADSFIEKLMKGLKGCSGVEFVNIRKNSDDYKTITLINHDSQRAMGVLFYSSSEDYEDVVNDIRCVSRRVETEGFCTSGMILNALKEKYEVVEIKYGENDVEI